MTDLEDSEEYYHLNFEEKVERMIFLDDKELLVSTVKQLIDDGEFWFFGHSPSYLLNLVAQYKSVECAAALLRGEAGISLDVNVAGEDGAFPVHDASVGWCVDLIKVYVEHGADIDVRCAPHHPSYAGMLPLNIVLHLFRDHFCVKDWTPKQSIFKLIIRLCLPKVRPGLDVVKFLAWNTKGAQEEIYHYARKGEIIELAVLLMVAREKFNAPSPFPSNDGSMSYDGLTIRQVIIDEIALLMDEDVRNIARGKGNSLTRISKDKLKLMKAALQLLEAFERAGDAIDAYLQLQRTDVPAHQVANEVASLLQEAGFVLKHQDIDLSATVWFPSECTLRDIVSSVSKFRPKYLDMSLSTQPCSIQPYRNNEDKSQNMTSLVHRVSNPKGLNPDEVSLNMEEDIKDLIVADNKHEFVYIIKSLSIIKSQLGKQNPDISKSKVFPSELLKWVCCHHAVNCATAILDGETDLRVDLNSSFKCGSFPLHHAAHSVSSGLIELFLQHGADANLRCDGAGSKFLGLLPLNVALNKLSCHQFLTDWTPKKSIYKLIFILCRPEMNEPLDAIKLLALKTKEVEEIIFHHAKKGDLIELAALLMVAQEKVMAQNNDGSCLDGSMRIRQCIIHETTSLDEEFISIDGSQFRKMVRMHSDKWALMSSVLLLLEVFERAGPAIEEYIQCRSMHVPPESIPTEVAWMLSEVGFKLKEKDIVMNDIKCFSPKLGPPQSEELKQCRSLVKKFPMPLNSRQGGVLFAKSVSGMPNQQQRSICFSHGYQVSSPVSQSYHTFQIPKPNCGSKFVATLETKVKKTTKPSNKQWVSFAFAITRKLRQV